MLKRLGRWSAATSAVLTIAVLLLLTVPTLALAATTPAWPTAGELQVPAGGSSPSLLGVSCTSAHNCQAVGGYFVAGVGHALLATETNGSWTPTSPISPPSSAGSGVSLDLDAITCLSAENCVAVGSYSIPSADSYVFAVTETDGTWGSVNTITLPDNAAAQALPELASVACTSPGNCVAVGSYDNSDSTSDPPTATP